MASMLWGIKTVFGCLVSTNWISPQAFKIYSTQTPWSQSLNANQQSLLSTQFPRDFHFGTQWDIAQSLPFSFHYLCPLSTIPLESTSNVPVTPSRDYRPPHTVKAWLCSHLRNLFLLSALLSPFSRCCFDFLSCSPDCMWSTHARMLFPELVFSSCSPAKPHSCVSLAWLRVGKDCIFSLNLWAQHWSLHCYNPTVYLTSRLRILQDPTSWSRCCDHSSSTEISQ